MPSPQFKAVFQQLLANPIPDDLTFAQQRAMADELAAQTPLPADVSAEPIDMDGLSGLLVAAQGANDQRIVLYFYGGGYCRGSSLAHRDYGWRLSAAANARVLLPDYRLAPEHPFPAAVEDATAAYRWLLKSGLPPDHIAIGGDSAGGGLTMAALVALRDQGVALPKTAALISPWTDLTQTGSSVKTNAAADPTLTPQQLAYFAGNYLGGADPQTPLASPLYADLGGLPPILIHVGAPEILLDDATRLAERATAAGVNVTLDVWEEMFHVWHLFAGIVPESQEALEQIGTYIQEQFGTGD